MPQTAHHLERHIDDIKNLAEKFHDIAWSYFTLGEHRESPEGEQLCLDGAEVLMQWAQAQLQALKLWLEAGVITEDFVLGLMSAVRREHPEQLEIALMEALRSNAIHSAVVAH